jgi:hypothetical protein
MKNKARSAAKFQSFKNGEEGQDLVEYALLVALIALTVVAGCPSTKLNPHSYRALLNR